MDVILDVISEELCLNKEHVKLEDNFYEIGGNSTNAVSVVVKLRKAGFTQVKVPDIINAGTIGDLVDVVTEKSIPEHAQSYTEQAQKVFKMYTMDENSDRKAISNLFAAAFFLNNNIFRTVVTEEAFRLFVETNYDVMTKQKLSRYVVDTRTNKIVACNMTIDRTTKLVCTSGFADAFEILGVAESFADAVIAKDTGRWADSYLTAISPGLPAEVGTYLLMKMEDTAVELADDAGFDGIMCCQMHPATGIYSNLQIDSGFEEVGRIDLKKHKFSGGRLLFQHLPDSEVSRTIIKRF